jgi:hypothetical protein
MSNIYYITTRTSETGQKFGEIEAKINRIREQQIQLSHEIGFTKWRGDYWSFMGGFSSLYFEKEPDRYIYKQEKTANEWMPKKNTREGRALDAKLKSTEVIGKRELNMCINFKEEFFSTIGFAWSSPSHFGFVLDSEWGHVPPIDCEEVTYSKYEELFEKDSE